MRRTPEPIHSYASTSFPDLTRLNIGRSRYERSHNHGGSFSAASSAPSSAMASSSAVLHSSASSALNSFAPHTTSTSNSFVYRPRPATASSNSFIYKSRPVETSSSFVYKPPPVAASNSFVHRPRTLSSSFDYRPISAGSNSFISHSSAAMAHSNSFGLRRSLSCASNAGLMQGI